MLSTDGAGPRAASGSRARVTGILKSCQRDPKRQRTTPMTLA